MINSDLGGVLDSGRPDLHEFHFNDLPSDSGVPMIPSLDDVPFVLHDHLPGDSTKTILTA
jgi:hypothetical protein